MPTGPTPNPELNLHLPGQLQMTFGSYRTGIQGLSVARDLMTYARQKGLEKLVKLSFDMEDLSNIKLKLKGPLELLDAYKTKLAEDYPENDFVIVPDEVDLFPKEKGQEEN